MAAPDGPAHPRAARAGGPQGGLARRRPAPALDHQGRDDALALVPLLTCFDPVRVVSSSALRCTETVAPYAAHVGAPVEVDDAFLVPGRVHDSSHRTGLVDQAPALERLLAAGVPTLVCAHRENIPELLALACAYLGAKPPPEPYLPKSGFWVLQAAESNLAGIERYDVSAPDLAPCSARTRATSRATRDTPSVRLNPGNSRALRSNRTLSGDSEPSRCVTYGT